LAKISIKIAQLISQKQAVFWEINKLVNEEPIYYYKCFYPNFYFACKRALILNSNLLFNK